MKDTADWFWIFAIIIFVGLCASVPVSCHMDIVKRQAIMKRTISEEILL